MSYLSINNVVISGGVHGNELTGIYAIKKYEKSFHLVERPTFETHLLLANPKAVQLNCRYVDIDLNRCFKSQDIENLNLTHYEQIRAKQIVAIFEQKNIDFIIDLHSTTSNMGVSIILNNSQHPFLLRLAAYLCAINSFPVKVLQYQAAQENSPYLRCQSELGLAIEVGPVCHGVLNSDLFLKTDLLIQQTLDFINNSNQGKVLKLPPTLTLYKQVGILDYPRDNKGQLQAMIHPKIKDYEPLNSKMPFFLDFSGNAIDFSKKNRIFVQRVNGKTIDYFPVFVGEASYIEKGIAMSLTLEKSVPVPKQC